MKSKVSRAFKVSLGGIITAVCLLLMFCSGFLPMLNYTIPMFAGFLMVVVIVEIDKKWAFMTYCAVSILSLLITPNYEASLLFIMFMGYYPILKFGLERMKSKAFAWLIKYIVFNIAIVCFFLLFQYVFTSVDMLEDMGSFGKWAVPVLWISANVVFLFYDYVLGQAINLYTEWFRKKILVRK